MAIDGRQLEDASVTVAKLDAAVQPSIGLFSPGSGTDAIVGGGATAPTAAGDNSLAHGDSNAATGNRTTAFGAYAVAANDDQHVLGSNRTVAGQAQASTFVKYVTWTAGAAAVILDLPLEVGKTYGIEAKITIRESVAAQGHAFFTGGTVAYRNAVGGAIVAGGTTFLSSIAESDASGFWAEITSLVNNVRIQIRGTGGSAVTYVGCAHITVVEVAS